MNKKRVFINIATFFMVFIFMFGKINSFIYPFIFALCFALINYNINIYFVISAIILGVIFDDLNIVNLIIYLTMTAFLLICSMLNFIKNAKLRNNLCILSLILSQSAFLFFNLPSRMGLVCSLVSILSSVLLFYIYKIVLRAVFIKGFNGQFSKDEILCFYIFMISLFYSIGKISFYNFYPVYAISLLVILVSCLTLSDSLTLTLSLVMGIGVSLTNNSILGLSVILIWAFSAVILKNINRYVLCFGIIIIDILLGFVFNAYINYSYYNLIYVCLPVLIILLLKNTVFAKISAFFNVKMLKIAENYIIENNQKQLNRSIENIKNAITDSNSVYKSLYLKSVSSDDIVNWVCNEVNDNYCLKCNNSVCNFKAKIYENIKTLVEKAFNKKISLIDISSDQSFNCFNINEIINLINDAVNEYSTYNKKIDEQNVNLNKISETFNSFNIILSNLISQNNNYIISDKFNISDCLSEFSYYNLMVKEIIFCEDKLGNFAHAYMVVRSRDAGKSAFGEVLSKILGFKVILVKNDVSEFIGWNILTYEIAPKYDLFIGVSQKSVQSENGDNYIVTKNKNFHTVAIADGMGNGKTANSVSNLCLDLYFNFQKANVDDDIAISIINKLIIPVNKEQFVTIDIANFNLYNGNVNFIKYGSSISLIRHSDKIEIVRPESLPLGVVNKITATIESKSVSPGDFVILASDGVVDAFSEDGLISFISNIRTTNAQIMADEIIEEAEFRATNIDDLTCLVVKINNR